MTAGSGESPEAPPRSKPRRRRQALSGFLLILILIWAANFFLVTNPVRTALQTDPRNERYRLVAHYRYFVDPSTLVLDIRDLDGAAPADLFRGLFQSAEALHDAGRTFSTVALSRSRTVVFYMDGADFDRIGQEYGGGQNIVYLVRTLPEKLHEPDGSAAYGTWTGGILGVALKQMEDVADAGKRWAQGR